MLALPLVVLIVAFVWLLNAPGQRFLPAFARLLDDAAVHAGPWSFLTGRSVVSGTAAGRDVVAILKLRRGRYSQGSLNVAMRTRERAVLDAAGIETHATGDAARRALFVLAKRDLGLSTEDGWLKAHWQPQGFVLFPGTFQAAVWRDVLDAMQTVAASLDASSAG